MSRGCPSGRWRCREGAPRDGERLEGAPRDMLVRWRCREGAPRDADGPLDGPPRNHPPTGSEISPAVESPCCVHDQLVKHSCQFTETIVAVAGEGGPVYG